MADDEAYWGKGADRAAPEAVRFLQGPQPRGCELARLFRIVGEVIRGFRTFHFLGPCVTVFGSARFGPDHRCYRMARDLGAGLARAGFTVMTGGGPGVMEAANRGASEAGGPSVGYNIKLKTEQGLNPYVTPGMSFEFEDFSTRKKGLRYGADAHVFGPGGFGTLDELFEVLTLIQTGKLPRAPVVLVGSRTFWKDVFNVHALARRGVISKDDVKLISFVETEEEAWRAIAKHYPDHPEYAIGGAKRHPGSAVFQKVFDALEKAGVRFVVVGGYAVRFLGHPRLAPDLDLVVGSEDRLPDVLAVDEDAVAAAVVLDQHPVGALLEPRVDARDMAAVELDGAGLAPADGAELGDLEGLPA